LNKSLQVHTSQQHSPGHSYYSLDISHGGLLNEEIVSRVFKLATSVLLDAILTQSSLRSSSSNKIASQLHRHIYLDTTHGKSIRQSLDEMGIPTLEQV
jgi:hypothetical protein